MTREEAIDELQKAIDLIKQNGKDWLDERDIPILQMAITALELSDSIMLQLDCKMFHSGVNVDNIVSDETTDIIYRQAAIDEIEYELEMINSALDSITLDFNARKRLRQRRGEAREILNSIQQLPSAQPEIIMCNDCKHRRQNNYGDSWCAHSKGLDGYELMPTDFCCRGEWKEDENYKQN